MKNKLQLRLINEIGESGAWKICIHICVLSDQLVVLVTIECHNKETKSSPEKLSLHMKVF